MSTTRAPIVKVVALLSLLGVAVVLLAGTAGGGVGDGVLRTLTAGAVLLAVVAAVVHVVWALGGLRESRAFAVPADPDGRPAFIPGPLATLAVAGALVCLAAMLWLLAWGRDVPSLVSVAGWVALGLLTLRVIGDGRQIGLTKRDRSTTFAARDDAVYTPLVVALALGTLAAMLV